MDDATCHGNDLDCRKFKDQQQEPSCNNKLANGQNSCIALYSQVLPSVFSPKNGSPPSTAKVRLTNPFTSGHVGPILGLPGSSTSRLAHLRRPPSSVSGFKRLSSSMRPPLNGRVPSA